MRDYKGNIALFRHKCSRGQDGQAALPRSGPQIRARQRASRDVRARREAYLAWVRGVIEAEAAGQAVTFRVRNSNAIIYMLLCVSLPEGRAFDGLSTEDFPMRDNLSANDKDKTIRLFKIFMMPKTSVCPRNSDSVQISR